ncbi:hypothetical protein CAPTEDRAFT_221957 [Capitella teleta]|uniref:Axonemal dynein light chain domain-containing protein 1 n=1 Tax=Capitella teleta TaxID=283909 RepID=R7VKZ5_CAPTE|nr:hypothetical protein CAPTEDRAFT_221957 [Capitella teleta]|eukprot:ELU17826.1 hypothetical protein CAPTEDRAFT_221957 [Capitella teleta]
MSLMRSPHFAKSPRSKSSQSLLKGEESSKQIMLPELKANQTMVDKTRPLPTSLQSDFLPEDVLLALTQPAPPSDKLGPSHRHRNLHVSEAFGRKPPSNVWNFPKGRERLGHLTKATPCVCGAGQDISFLYDVPKKEGETAKPNKHDPSFIRAAEQEEPKQGLKLPDTLIPEEYHIVKNKGVLGLEFHEENPTSRYEVVKLRKALAEMLNAVGANDLESVGFNGQGATQMHNLLEIIKKEQNIYNMVFHELIRQVSIECVERGELLSMLRDKYSELFSKVPAQIKGLHEEVLAQRALDRRLTEELMRFKSTISVLTSELSVVKEHDQEVTNQATRAKQDLKSALSESQKNASLLTEYHALYELQRKRLEKQVSLLAGEKEVWSSAAYSLALKVIEEHSLNSCKRLHVCEKAWVKLVNHFTILLSDQDTDMLTKLQAFVDRWRDLTEEFNRNILSREDTMRQELELIREDFQKWKMHLMQKLLSPEGHLVQHPDEESLSNLHKDMKRWEDCLGHESEKFGGDILLSGQEALQEITRLVESWTDCALKVFNRHRGENGEDHPDHLNMLNMNEEIAVLVKQYHVRLTGENGVATGLIHLGNAFEMWSGKVNMLLNGSNPLQDQDWLRFMQCLDEWSAFVLHCLALIGSTQKEDEKNKEEHPTVSVDTVLQVTQKWLSSTTNGIDNEDAKLVEQVSTMHIDAVKWMVQMLLRLAPDQKHHTAEAKEAVLLGSATIGQLQSNAKLLFEQMTSFTKYVSICCSGIVTETMQRKMDAREDDAQQEYQELMLLKSECDDWVRTAKIMVCELTGEEYVEPVALSTENTKSSLMVAATPVTAEMAGRETTDMEKTKEEISEEEEEEKEEAKEEEAKGEKAAEKKEEKREEIQEGNKEDDKEKEEIKQNEEDLKEIKEEEPKEENKEEATKEEVKAEELKTEREENVEHVEKVEDTSENGEELVEVDGTNKEKEEEKEEEKGEKLEYLGHDNNTHTHCLEQDPAQAPREMHVTKREAVTHDTTPVVTPDTKKAYEALAAVSQLQDELLSTEERAQQMEEKALDLESQLSSEKEKIRELERIIAQMELDAEEKKAPKLVGTDRPQVNLPPQTPSSPPDKKASRSPDKKASPSPSAKTTADKPTSGKSNRSSGKSRKK